MELDATGQMISWLKEHDFSKSCVWEARFKSAVRKGAAKESTRGGPESQLWDKVLGKWESLDF